MSDRLDAIVARAVAAGVLPDTAAPPEQSTRPWPVVLLIALGAWLAAIPLLSAVSLLLGGILILGIGPYVVGVLLLGAAVVVLRARDVPLFVEQLAVPVLLVGGGCLGFGLFRDLPERAGAAVLAAVALGLAAVIPRPWLRVLLGAGSATLVTVVLAPGTGGGDWLAVHGVLLLWGIGLGTQRVRLNNGAMAPCAAAVESIAAGWLLAALATLAWLSGATFLVGGGLGGWAGIMAGASASDDTSGWQFWLIPAVSAALALTAAGWAARAWPTLRRPATLGVAAALGVLAWFLPALGAALLVLAVTATTHRFLLAGAAALSAAWIVGSFYYQLQWPLATKAAVLAAIGVLLGVLAWLAHRPDTRTPESAAPSSSAHRGPTPWLIGLGAAATLAVANLGIWQKETLIAEGRPVFVELAPVDPRSLMQGDYMRLRFRIPAEVRRDAEAPAPGERPRVVARRDERGVATVLRLHRPGAPLGENELLIELTPKNGRWILVTDAWFFREGEADRWEEASYGEFRVDADGKALLVGMADARLRAIEP